MKKLKNKINLLICSLFLAMQPCFAISLSMSPEMKLVAKKFILAMIGVAIASVLIFIVLSVYNRFFHNPKVNEKTTYDENTLEQSKNIDNSVSNFLNRTNL